MTKIGWRLPSKRFFTSARFTIAAPQLAKGANGAMWQTWRGRSERSDRLLENRPIDENLAWLNGKIICGVINFYL